MELGTLLDTPRAVYLITIGVGVALAGALYAGAGIIRRARARYGSNVAPYAQRQRRGREERKTQ